MPDGKPVEIKPAKGRPMLTWVGKRPLRNVTAYPAQLVETFAPRPDLEPGRAEEGWADWPEGFPRGGLLFHGDNKDVLAHLLANGFRGKVKLIYIDPPFDSGADYVRKVVLRAESSTKLEADGYTLGEQIQYSDIWVNDTYLQFMYERLLMLKELLREDGAIFIHCDDSKGYLIRILADEIFGQEKFVNEIIWKRKGATSFARKQLGRIVDHVLWYSKGMDYTFNPIYSLDDENTKNYIAERFVFDDNDGRGRYMKSPLVNPLVRPNLRYEYKGYPSPPNGWLYSQERMREMDSNGELVFPENKSQRISRKIYLKTYKGQLVQNLWDDIFVINPMAEERLAFPTQKPQELLKRLIYIASDPGDIVLDSFIGSGTTAAAAQELGRKWIGADINKGAIQTTIKRLQGVIEEQAGQVQQGKLFEDGDQAQPAQLSFAEYRVNDYDLQIQHNEAFNWRWSTWE